MHKNSYLGFRSQFIVCALFLTLLLVSNTALAEEQPGVPDHCAEIEWIKMMNHPTHRAANPQPDLRYQGRDTDWQAMIDAVWGPGRPASDQTHIFENFIQTLDYQYALFRNRDVDIVALSQAYLPEIQAGVSKGRFHAILNKMCVAVQNGHTSLRDMDVYLTIPEPGVPLLVGHRYMNHPYFGACLTTS